MILRFWWGSDVLINFSLEPSCQYACSLISISDALIAEDHTWFKMGWCIVSAQKLQPIPGAANLKSSSPQRLVCWVARFEGPGNKKKFRSWIMKYWCQEKKRLSRYAGVIIFPDIPPCEYLLNSKGLTYIPGSGLPRQWYDILGRGQANDMLDPTGFLFALREVMRLGPGSLLFAGIPCCRCLDGIFLGSKECKYVHSVVLWTHCLWCINIPTHINKQTTWQCCATEFRMDVVLHASEIHCNSRWHQCLVWSLGSINQYCSVCENISCLFDDVPCKGKPSCGVETPLLPALPCYAWYRMSLRPTMLCPGWRFMGMVVFEMLCAFRIW